LVAGGPAQFKRPPGGRFEELKLSTRWSMVSYIPLKTPYSHLNLFTLLKIWNNNTYIMTKPTTSEYKTTIS
jgi:hypothetical protein